MFLWKKNSTKRLRGVRPIKCLFRERRWGWRKRRQGGGEGERERERQRQTEGKREPHALRVV